jgi:hypothetical protein
MKIMKKNMPLLFFIAIMVIILFIWGFGENNAPDYTAFSARPAGAGLLFDTLQYMGYPVFTGQAPVDNKADVNDIFIVIQPNNPPVSRDMAEEILRWVRRGGRMIFLDREYPTVMDYALDGNPSAGTGNFTHYRLGLGEVVTGRAEDILNGNLMRDSAGGFFLQTVLASWDGNRIWFSEYYHGYRTPDNFYTRLPLAVKLAGIQLVVITLLILWHMGKRFGKPVPYYEETERDENGHIRALARLYKAAGRKS